MKSKKKTKPRKPPTAAKKAASGRKAKKLAPKLPPLTYQRKVEEEFIGEHPEAFDPYVGQWVVLEGRSIIAHGSHAAVVADEARARGVKVPYIFRVLPKLPPNQAYLF